MKKLKVEDVITLWKICDEIVNLTSTFCINAYYNQYMKCLEETLISDMEKTKEYMYSLPIHERLKDEDLCEIIEAIVQDMGYDSGDIMECFSKSDIKEYLRYNYDPDDFICMEWDY